MKTFYDILHIDVIYKTLFRTGSRFHSHGNHRSPFQNLYWSSRYQAESKTKICTMVKRAKCN